MSSEPANEETREVLETRYQKQTLEMTVSSLPSPEYIEAYEKLHKGSVELILTKFSEEQAHRHEIENNESNCNIQATHKGLSLENKDLNFNFIGHLVGQIFSLIICLGAMAASCYLAMQGHRFEAIAIVSVPLAAIIRAIMRK